MIHYLRMLAARLRGLFGDRRADREFDNEIEAHLRMLTERYVRQGMTEAEAETVWGDLFNRPVCGSVQSGKKRE